MTFNEEKKRLFFPSSLYYQTQTLLENHTVRYIYLLITSELYYIKMVDSLHFVWGGVFLWGLGIRDFWCVLLSRRMEYGNVSICRLKLLGLLVGVCNAFFLEERLLAGAI